MCRNRPGGADRNAIPLYDFPAQEIGYNFIADMPLRVSALRSLGAFANVFAIESFMDELAAATNTDAIEFRLRHLQDARAREVIETVAKAARWTTGEKGDGTRGRGLGFARYKNRSAYCAVIAEVEVGETLRVKRVVAAVDAGQVVNPDGLDEPDRRRDRSSDQLDPQGAGPVGSRPGVVALLGKLSDPALR